MASKELTVALRLLAQTNEFQAEIVKAKATVAGLGEDIATNVGLNYRRVMLLGTGLIAIATGVVTVVVGNLPFLGLIVPNIVSMVRGDDLRSNLPWVALLGIAIVTVCDIIGRVGGDEFAVVFVGKGQGQHDAI